MTRTGGNRPAWDEEPTLEGLPDEPTVSAHVDVRAAFEAQDVTMPGERTVPAAVAMLVTSDAPPDRQDHTLPFGARATSVDAPRRGRINTQPLMITPRGVVVEDPPYEIPGVGPAGAQRKRMVRIVAAVLSLCGLLCVGALVRQLWPEAKSDETKTAASATATSSTPASVTASAAAAATSVPENSPPAPPAVAAVASEGPATAAAAAAAASAAPVASAAPAPTAAPVASAAPAPTAEPAATAAQVVAVPPPPTTAVPIAAANPPRRPQEPRGALVHPKTATTTAPPSAPPTAKAPPRGNIVRDSPF